MFWNESNSFCFSLSCRKKDNMEVNSTEQKCKYFDKILFTEVKNIKNHFKNERACRDIKTEKAQKQDYLSNKIKQTTSI